MENALERTYELSQNCWKKHSSKSILSEPQVHEEK
jgi:hypothetical protein